MCEFAYSESGDAAKVLIGFRVHDAGVQVIAKVVMPVVVVMQDLPGNLPRLRRQCSKIKKL